MTERPDNIHAAEVCLPSTDLTADLAYYTEALGFRLDTIFPADDPAVATLSGYGVRLRLERGSDGRARRAAAAVPRPRRRGRRPARAHGAQRRPHPARRRRPAGRAAADRPRVRGAAPEGQRALGHRPRRHGVSRSDSGTARRQHHRLPHPHPRRRAGARHGALPHGRLSADLLLQRLGAAGLRGPGAAVRPRRRRLRDPAAAHPPPRARGVREASRSSRSACRPNT